MDQTGGLQLKREEFMCYGGLVMTDWPQAEIEKIRIWPGFWRKQGDCLDT